jgi:hypothetical protein
MIKSWTAAERETNDSKKNELESVRENLKAKLRMAVVPIKTGTKHLPSKSKSH